MSYSLKPGVISTGAQAPIWWAISQAESVWSRYGAPLVVTSLLEGQHVRNSLHPYGMAADLRIWNLPSGAAGQAARELQQALGADFQVMLESDHIHIEHQPRSGSGPSWPTSGGELPAAASDNTLIAVAGAGAIAIAFLLFG